MGIGFGRPDILTVDDVRQISESVIREEIHDYYLVKEELRALKSGERVLLPVNKEHATYMLKVAMSYLGIDINQDLIVKGNHE